MPLLDILKPLIKLPKKFTTMESIELQKDLSPKLREYVVTYLTKSQSTKAKAFRGEYVNTLVSPNQNTEKDSEPAWQAYLDAQRRNGTWGTYIEAGALGEAFKCNVFVIPVKDNAIQSSPISLHFQDVNAPTVVLYNHGNAHWSFTKDPKSTEGDNNCLYNAFAQSLQQIVKRENKIQNPQLSYTLNTTSKNDEDTINVQKMILNLLKEQPLKTPQEVEKELLEEQQRMQNLPEDEQQQIIGDYLLALEIAAEENIENINQGGCHNVFAPYGHSKKNYTSNDYESPPTSSRIGM